MNILIGSRALNYWYPEVPINDSTDWDVISTEPLEGTEWHSLDVLNNRDIEGLLFNYEDEIDFNGITLTVAPPVVLSIIKRSHLHRDLGFDKHITHYHKYLADFKNFLTGDTLAFLEERTKLTLEQYPQVKPNLNQSVQDFFDDAVTKVYNHDRLHELFAYEDKPMYTKLQTNPEKAWCSEKLWYTLNHQQQLQCVAEETMVIATERFLVPKNWEFPSKLAYMKALKKVCTTLTSGYFRSFAIDYYPEVISLYNPDKFQQVKQILSKE